MSGPYMTWGPPPFMPYAQPSGQQNTLWSSGNMVFTGKRTLTMLLLGKTGTGKSATGNTILKKQQFNVSGSGHSITAEIDSGWADTNKYKLHIIDGPGLQDTNLTALQDRERACENMTKCMAECSGGVNAFLLVVKYGDRFTKEDREVVDALNSIWGENWLRDYGIVVVTNEGDWLHDHNLSTGTICSAEDWIRKEDYKFSNIFSACNYRCVFFNNRMPGQIFDERAVDRLITVVEGIVSTGRSYTNEHFQRAEQERNKLIVKLKEPMLKPKFQEDCNLLTGKIMEIYRMADHGQKYEGIKDVVQKANKLLEDIKREDRNSGQLATLENMVHTVIDEANKANFKRLGELGKELEEMRKKHKASMDTKGFWKICLSGMGLLFGIAAGVATVLTGGAVGIGIGATVAASATSFTGAAGVHIYQDSEREDFYKKTDEQSKYMM